MLSIPRISSDTETPDRTAVWTRLADFWMMGGFSILFLIVLQIASVYRSDNFAIETRFMQLAGAFSILAIICNYPHFIISYHLAYSRGFRFIFKNWFALLTVPFVLITAIAAAYLSFNLDLSESSWVLQLNDFFAASGLSFRFGESAKIGGEIVSALIWLMYMLVGWHYCKQAYGCIMVYAHYDKFPLGVRGKQLIKYGVFSVAFFQFLYMTHVAEKYPIGGHLQDPKFRGFHLSPFGFPTWLYDLALITLVGMMAAMALLFIRIYIKQRRIPSANLIIPLLALFMWWIPLGQFPEYFAVMVPFFHSLQYLPFAMTLENSKLKKNKWLNSKISASLALVVFIGFSAFELIPSIVDKVLYTEIHQTEWFFGSVFAIFINIHHYFIDSVTWKFQHHEIQNHLLRDRENQTAPESIPVSKLPAGALDASSAS